MTRGTNERQPMTNQVIPEAAVEAAAKALWQTDQHDDTWAGEFPTYMDYLRAEATKALEAAAPHIAAGAWDEGWDAGTLSQFTEPHNPYTHDDTQGDGNE